MLKNNSGNAVIEMIPIMIIMMLLLNFSIGFWGVIHTGILNSIAARNYAFETFSNRANLNVFREIPQAGNNNPNYAKIGFRFHGVIGEQGMTGNAWTATIRPIKYTDLKSPPNVSGSSTEHTTTVRNIAEDKKVSETFSGAKKEDGNNGFDPVWIQTLYGMCLKCNCGDTQLDSVCK